MDDDFNPFIGMTWIPETDLQLCLDGWIVFLENFLDYVYTYVE